MRRASGSPGTCRKEWGGASDLLKLLLRREHATCWGRWGKQGESGDGRASPRHTHLEYLDACSTQRHPASVSRGRSMREEVPWPLPPGLDSVYWVYPAHVCWVCSDVGGIDTQLCMAPGLSAGLGVSSKCDSCKCGSVSLEDLSTDLCSVTWKHSRLPSVGRVPKTLPRGVAHLLVFA